MYEGNCAHETILYKRVSKTFIEHELAVPMMRMMMTMMMETREIATITAMARSRINNIISSSTTLRVLASSLVVYKYRWRMHVMMYNVSTSSHFGYIHEHSRCWFCCCWWSWKKTEMYISYICRRHKASRWEEEKEMYFPLDTLLLHPSQSERSFSVSTQLTTTEPITNFSAAAFHLYIIYNMNMYVMMGNVLPMYTDDRLYMYT